MDNISLQLYSIKESSEKDLLGTLKKVAEMGYNGAQFAGFFNHDAEDVKEKMDSVGIKAAGAHVQIDQLQHQLDETLKYNEIIGNRLVILSSLPEDMRKTADDYKKTAEILDGIGRKLYNRGFELVYHNHGFEFESLEGTTGFDILFENATSEHLKMELDCFWAACAGYDPIEIINKYAKNCVSLHIKDMIIRDEQRFSTELGTGILPLADYVKKGNEVGVKWLVVEQEEFTKDPLDSAEINVKEIRRLLE